MPNSLMNRPACVGSSRKLFRSGLESTSIAPIMQPGWAGYIKEATTKHRYKRLVSSNFNCKSYQRQYWWITTKYQSTLGYIRTPIVGDEAWSWFVTWTHIVPLLSVACGNVANELISIGLQNESWRSSAAKVWVSNEFDDRSVNTSWRAITAILSGVPWRALPPAVIDFVLAVWG